MVLTDAPIMSGSKPSRASVSSVSRMSGSTRSASAGATPFSPAEKVICSV